MLTVFVGGWFSYDAICYFSYSHRLYQVEDILWGSEIGTFTNVFGFSLI